jgi:hypothetical protein
MTIGLQQLNLFDYATFASESWDFVAYDLPSLDNS